MATRVCVTGGAGFIGSHLVRGLLEAGHTVRVLDDLSTGDRANLSEVQDDVELLEADLRDPDACARACAGVEVVYHQGALPSVPRSIKDPLGTFQVNVLGTHQLYLAAREAGVRRVVFASSSSIYGNVPTLPKHEQLAPQPASPYAAQKLAGEQLGMAFTRSMDLEVAALRYFNVYGPRQNTKSGYAAVIAAFASRLLRGEPPRIDGDGGQTRDFTYVGDVVRANMRAASQEGAAGQTMNIACGDRTSINDLYRIIARLTGREDMEPEHAPPREGDVRDSLAAIEHAQRCMGWAPQVSLEEGLRLTVEGYRAAL